MPALPGCYFLFYFLTFASEHRVSVDRCGDWFCSLGVEAELSPFE